MSNGMEWLGASELGDDKYPRPEPGRYQYRLVEYKIKTFKGAFGVAVFDVIAAEPGSKNKVGDRVSYVEDLKDQTKGGVGRFGRMTSALLGFDPTWLGPKSDKFTKLQMRGLQEWLVAKDPGDGTQYSVEYGLEVGCRVMGVAYKKGDEQKMANNCTFQATTEAIELNANGIPSPAGRKLPSDAAPNLPGSSAAPDLELPSFDTPELPGQSEPATVTVNWQSNGFGVNPIRLDSYFRGPDGTIKAYSTKEKPGKADWVTYDATKHPAPESAQASA